MSQVTRNALKGYSYQDYIYILFMTLMDTSEEILAIDAEVGKDQKKHDFDDIKLYTKDKVYLVQAKDYKEFDESKFKVNSESIKVNNVMSKLSKDTGNIFVLHNCPLVTDCCIWGLNAIAKDNLYIIPLPAECVRENIRNRYGRNTERENQIIHFAKDRLANEEFLCRKEELPQMQLFRQKMETETILIREAFCRVKNSVFYVVGKPGVGKSHYVHELAENLENTLIYHFWIGSQDEYINERLQYENFIKELGYRIYHDCRKFTEEELIEKIREQNKILIIDGLDHVENYNERQLENYFEFFSKLNGIKTIVLTRPLRHAIGDAIYQLGNWNFKETSYYLEKCHRIYDRKIQQEIFQITDGYPILTYFSAQHYLLYGKLESTEKIVDINEYYRQLIEKAGIQKAMMIFNVTNAFLTKEDINIIASNEILSGIIFDSIKTYPYLFQQRYNRIMLIHDSFNTFLREETAGQEESMQPYLHNIEKSLISGDVRFMSRLMSLSISESIKDELLKKYSNFDTFFELVEATWDIESVVEFYNQLLQYLSFRTADVLDIYQYYSFILIQKCCGRVQVGYDMDMLYQQVAYAYNYKRQCLKEVFSNRTLFKICELVFKFDKEDIKLNDISPIEQDESIFKHETEKRFFEAAEKDTDYFEKYMKKLDYDEFISTQLQSNREETDKYRDCAQLVVNLYLSDDNFKGIRKELQDYLDGNVINESTCKIGDLLKSCGVRIAESKDLLAYCKHILFSIGKIEKDNPYRRKSIKALLLNKQEKCSDKTSDVVNYIRLALYEGRDISIAEANYCYIMLQEEKDYTALWLPDATLVYEKNFYLTLTESLNVLTDIMNLSSRGLNGLIDNYINKLSPAEFKYLIEEDFLKSQYPINVYNWEPELVNCVPEEYMYDQLIQLMRSKYYSKIIEEHDWIYLIESKYGKMAKDFVESNGFRIYNLNTNLDNSNREKSYKERGYVNPEDKDQIIADGLGCLELASYKSGNNDSFPELSLFEIYSDEELVQKFLKIIHTSLTTKSKTIEAYGNMYSFVAHLPMFANRIGYEMQWKTMFEIFKKFLFATGVEIHN